MKEHPILFSTSMVQAILEGRKTQTRRVISKIVRMKDGIYTSIPTEFMTAELIPNNWPCPYGQVGDRLWVRERWSLSLRAIVHEGFERLIEYRADDSQIVVPDKYDGWFDQKEKRGYLDRPSIHMPRWASRITLEITDIRVQRVQEITPAEVTKEGLGWDKETLGIYNDDIMEQSLIAQFHTLWNTINSKRGYSWESNPWVWAITFITTPDKR